MTPYPIAEYREPIANGWRNVLPEWIRGADSWAALKTARRHVLSVVCDSADGRADAKGSRFNARGGASLAARVGCSVRSLKRHLMALEAQGFIVCTEEGGIGPAGTKANVYAVPGERGALEAVQIKRPTVIMSPVLGALDRSGRQKYSPQKVGAGWQTRIIGPADRQTERRQGTRSAALSRGSRKRDLGGSGPLFDQGGVVTNCHGGSCQNVTGGSDKLAHLHNNNNTQENPLSERETRIAPTRPQGSTDAPPRHPVAPGRLAPVESGRTDPPGRCKKRTRGGVSIAVVRWDEALDAMRILKVGRKFRAMVEAKKELTAGEIVDLVEYTRTHAGGGGYFVTVYNAKIDDQRAERRTEQREANREATEIAAAQNEQRRAKDLELVARVKALTEEEFAPAWERVLEQKAPHIRGMYQQVDPRNNPQLAEQILREVA